MELTRFASLVLLSTVSSSKVQLVAFDGSGPTFNFVEDEDMVMGSRSWGNWSVEQTSFGRLQGVVTRVERPAVTLVGASPGFIKAGANGKFPDASDAAGGELVLEVQSSKAYSGFHVALASGSVSPLYACKGGGYVPLSRGCFKSKFSVPEGSDFTAVRLPLANFSDLWRPADGELRKSCSQESSACVTAKVLSQIQRVEIVAEGTDGDIDLQLKSISVESRTTLGQILV